MLDAVACGAEPLYVEWSDAVSVVPMWLAANATALASVRTNEVTAANRVVNRVPGAFFLAMFGAVFCRLFSRSDGPFASKPSAFVFLTIDGSGTSWVGVFPSGHIRDIARLTTTMQSVRASAIPVELADCLDFAAARAMLRAVHSRLQNACG